MGHWMAESLLSRCLSQLPFTLVGLEMMASGGVRNRLLEA